ncbi:MAG: Ig-like domain-containing protein [Planctomycetota bacterium]
MRRVARCGFAIAILWTAISLGCSRPADWLRFERVEPTDRAHGVPLLALNQSISLYFSDALEPSSVTAESVRVIDSQGIPVDGSLAIGTRSIRFRPRTPVEPDLHDGSFRPGAEYRMELAGMPASYALRSKSGRPLERSLVLRFATARHPEQLGLYSLLLPVGVGEEELTVDLLSQTELRLPRRARTLAIPLTLPPLPSSVSTAAVTLWRIDPGANSPRPTRLASIRSKLIDERIPDSLTMAELVLTVAEDEPIAADDLLFLQFHAGDGGLLDYRGRPMAVPPAPLPVKVDPGERTRATDFGLESLRFEPDRDSAVGFEFAGGRLAPRLRVEAGTGESGAARVRSSERVTLAELVARSSETSPTPVETPGSVSAVDFSRLQVEEGGELEIAPGDRGIAVRVLGDIVIEGRLRLVGSHRPVPWRSGRSPGVDELLRSAGVALVCGGDFTLGPRASIEVSRERDGSPLTILLGGVPTFLGTAPPQLVVGLPVGSRIVGALESPVILPTALTRGVPETAVITAKAVSQWIPIGGEAAAAIDVATNDLRGAMRVAVQAAPADLSDPARPRPSAQSHSPPRSLPLAAPLAIPRGGFVRVLVEADVTSHDWPSLGGLAIEVR